MHIEFDVRISTDGAKASVVLTRVQVSRFFWNQSIAGLKSILGTTALYRALLIGLSQKIREQGVGRGNVALQPKTEKNKRQTGTLKKLRILRRRSIDANSPLCCNKLKPSLCYRIVQLLILIIVTWRHSEMIKLCPINVI